MYSFVQSCGQLVAQHILDFPSLLCICQPACIYFQFLPMLICSLLTITHIEVYRRRNVYLHIYTFLAVIYSFIENVNVLTFCPRLVPQQVNVKQAHGKHITAQRCTDSYKCSTKNTTSLSNNKFPKFIHACPSACSTNSFFFISKQSREK